MTTAWSPQYSRHFRMPCRLPKLRCFETGKMKFTIILLLVSAAAIAHPGVGIVMDSKGNVFYTDTKHVWKIGHDTNKKSIAIRNVHTHELYIDAQDNLFGEHLWYNGEAADTWGHYVWKYSPDGTFEKIIPDTLGFLTHYSFVRDRNGTMFWAERNEGCHKIGKKTPDGQVQVFGDACLHNIQWIAASGVGNVFLVDGHALKKVDPHGHIHTVTAHVFKGEGRQHDVMGLSTDEHENVYVAVSAERSVKKVSPLGQVFNVVKTNEAWMPTGTLHAPNGDLWILECNAMNEVRVERITKSGIRTVY